jgi:hypothetical protein
MLQILELHANVVSGREAPRLSHLAICYREKRGYMGVFTVMNIQKFPRFVGPRSTVIHTDLALTIQL